MWFLLVKWDAWDISITAISPLLDVSSLIIWRGPEGKETARIQFGEKYVEMFSLRIEKKANERIEISRGENIADLEEIEMWRYIRANSFAIR